MFTMIRRLLGLTGEDRNGLVIGFHEGKNFTVMDSMAAREVVRVQQEAIARQIEEERRRVQPVRGYGP